MNRWIVQFDREEQEWAIIINGVLNFETFDTQDAARRHAITLRAEMGGDGQVLVRKLNGQWADLSG